jgi:hypothetical protein
MISKGDFLREKTRAVIDAEAHYACSKGLAGASLEERQLRITESELAHRVRHHFADLETFLNAQGKAADRDVVSDSRSVEVEIKYFCTKVPQGGKVPLSDWRWLIGTKKRKPVRINYERLTLSFFPRGRYGLTKPKSKIPGE